MLCALSLCSFNCVINRPGLRTVLSEKYLEVFGWFETELESVQKIYESQKVYKLLCNGHENERLTNAHILPKFNPAL